MLDVISVGKVDLCLCIISSSYADAFQSGETSG